MNVLKHALLLTVVLVAAVNAGSWEHDLAVADKLLEAGYYEAAIEDYQKIVTAYPDLTPAVDRAWFGMGRAYHATGNVPAAKVALEKCLERSGDATAADGARSLYRQLKNEASLQAQEMDRAVQFFETRYHTTSWLNIITKLFDYFDLRKARKRFTEADDYDKSFDPRYLIDPVDVAKPADGTTSTLTAAEMEALLNKAGSAADVTAIDEAKPAEELGTDDGTTTTVEPVATTETAPAVSANPHADLKERRDTYLEAYRVLQEALRGQNQPAIQQANETFQQAQQAYKEAQAAVAALQR